MFQPPFNIRVGGVDAAGNNITNASSIVPYVTLQEAGERDEQHVHRPPEDELALTTWPSGFGTLPNGAGSANNFVCRT